MMMILVLSKLSVVQDLTFVGESIAACVYRVGRSAMSIIVVAGLVRLGETFTCEKGKGCSVWVNFDSTTHTQTYVHLFYLSSHSVQIIVII